MTIGRKHHKLKHLNYKIDNTRSSMMIEKSIENLKTEYEQKKSRYRGVILMHTNTGERLNAEIEAEINELEFPGVYSGNDGKRKSECRTGNLQARQKNEENGRY